MEVRRLTVDDAGALVALRRIALDQEPLAFSASPEDDVASDIDQVRRFLAEVETNATFGAFDPGLVGLVGIVRASKAKERHRAHIWGTFVLADHRGKGLGEALVRAAIETASAWPGIEQIDLGVGEALEPAHRLYEKLGFERWGTEPASLSYYGRTWDEHRMWLPVGGGEDEEPSG
jgi:ribosomal protein S18 acetylase RimI-like enzyme